MNSKSASLWNSRFQCSIRVCRPGLAIFLCHNRAKPKWTLAVVQRGGTVERGRERKGCSSEEMEGIKAKKEIKRRFARTQSANALGLVGIKRRWQQEALSGDLLFDSLLHSSCFSSALPQINGCDRVNQIHSFAYRKSLVGGCIF